MERAKRAGACLDRGDTGALGRLMTASHDGDRVARWKDGKSTPGAVSATDDFMDALIVRAEKLASLTQSRAALFQQPGAYACSTPEIDSLVDLANSCPGVLGAQLAGAGLGGCIMILLQTEAADQIRSTLESQYYQPRSLDPQLFVCHPSRGAQALTAVETAG